MRLSKEVDGRPPEQTCIVEEFTKGMRKNLVHDAQTPQQNQGHETGLEKKFKEQLVERFL